MPKPGTIRPEFMESGILLGREITLTLPNGEKRSAQFAIVELGNIIASHNEETFGDSNGYPLNEQGENINDRNYTGDKNAQANVISWAQNLEPERLITTSRTPSGTPIITKDGFVVSGNNRTMSLKLAARRHKERYDAYKEFLAEEVVAYGFDASVAVALLSEDPLLARIPLPSSSFYEPKGVQFTQPVLVRIDYDFPEYATAELAKYNKDTKKAERPIDRAIKLSKILRENERCFDIISETIGQYETFSDFYASRVHSEKMIRDLVNCDILTEQERPAIYDRDWTRSGKEFIENMLAAMILNKSALISSEKPGVRRFKNSIGTSLPVLLKNAQLGEASLKEEINQAVLLQAGMVNANLSFRHYVTQSSLFEKGLNRKALYLNRLLDRGRNAFKRAIEGYNSSMEQAAQPQLLGQAATPEEAFRHYIEEQIDISDKQVIEQVAGPPMAVVPADEKAKAKARAKALILLMKMKKAA